MARGDIVVRLIGDTRDLERKLGDAVTKSKSSFDKLAGVGKAALFGIGGALVGVGTESLHLADDFEKSHAQLANAIKASGSNISSYSAAIAGVDKQMEGFGFTNAQAEEALGHLTTATGSPKKALQEMGLAANIAKARNIDLATASDLVAKVMAGNLRPLKQFGIDLPVAAGGALKLQKAQEAVTKAQQAQSDAFHKYGPESAQYAKATAAVAEKQAALKAVAGASTSVLDALNKRFGGSAQAQAETFGGKIAALRAKGEDLGKNIGLALIPVLEKLATVVLGVVKWFQKHSEVAKVVAVVVGGILVTAIGAYVATMAVAAYETIAAMAPFLAIVAVIALVAAGVYEVIKHWKGIATWFKEVWKNVKHWFDDAWQFVKKIFLDFTPEGLIIKHWKGIAEFFKGIWRDAKHWFDDAWAFVKNIFLNFTPEGLIYKHWRGITGFFKGIWKDVKSGFHEAWSTVAGIVKSAINDVIAFLNSAIRGINSMLSFHVTIPKFIPGIGGKTLGFDVHIPQIPYLAAGGIVTSPTLAMLGEKGSEAVIPLGRGGLGGNTYNITFEIPPTVNKAELGREIVAVIQQYERRSGSTWRATT